jgi:hypothetical protein
LVFPVAHGQILSILCTLATGFLPIRTNVELNSMLRCNSLFIYRFFTEHRSSVLWMGLSTNGPVCLWSLALSYRMWPMESFLFCRCKSPLTPILHRASVFCHGWCYQPMAQSVYEVWLYHTECDPWRVFCAKDGLSVSTNGPVSLWSVARSLPTVTHGGFLFCRCKSLLTPILHRASVFCPMDGAINQWPSLSMKCCSFIPNVTHGEFSVLWKYILSLLVAHKSVVPLPKSSSSCNYLYNASHNQVPMSLLYHCQWPSELQFHCKRPICSLLCPYKRPAGL